MGATTTFRPAKYQEISLAGCRISRSDNACGRLAVNQGCVNMQFSHTNQGSDIHVHFD